MNKSILENVCVCVCVCVYVYTHTHTHTHLSIPGAQYEKPWLMHYTCHFIDVRGHGLVLFTVLN